MLQTLRNKIISRIAAKHVAGPDIREALKVCRWADKRNYSSILSLWMNGEKSSNGSLTPRESFERFKSDLYVLNKAGFKAYYSIKLDAIGYDLTLFRELLEVAQAFGIRLHADSLDPDSTTTSFRLFERTADYNKFMGCTLPSRWKRSSEDAERAADLGLSVRIVKGQWKDPGSVVDCRSNYLKIAGKLARRGVHLGIATHDRPLAEKVVKGLTGTGAKFELEQFFSLPLNGISIAEKYKCPYRVYVAYGYPAIPYNYRFALTRPALAAWMISDFAFNFSRPWVQNQ